jgi:hypothetical protein
LRLDRLRRGELLAGAGALALAVLMATVHWYGGRPPKTGWDALTSLRWLAVVTVAAALALVLLQATRRAPAVPVTMSVIVTVLGLPTALWLIYRVVISPADHQLVGAWLGLAGACLIVVGGVQSMRQEGISSNDEPHDIPLVRLRSQDPAA